MSAEKKKKQQPLTVALIGPSAGLQSLDRKCWVYQKVKRNWLWSACGRISRRQGEGRKGKKKWRKAEEGEGGARFKRDSREKTGREREEGWRGGRWWKCFCALCEMWSCPGAAQTAGKFPCPWLPAGNTLRRHQACRPYTSPVNPSSSAAAAAVEL